MPPLKGLSVERVLLVSIKISSLRDFGKRVGLQLCFLVEAAGINRASDPADQQLPLVDHLRRQTIM